MNRLILIAASFLLCISCSGARESESVGMSADALGGAPSIPVPVGPPYYVDDVLTPAWQGSAVDLMVADAWASCSFATEQTGYAGVCNIVEDGPKDPYMQWVRTQMQSATCDRSAADPNAAEDSNTFGKIMDARNAECDPNNNNSYPMTQLQQWYLQRTFRGCNAIAGTQNFQAVKLGHVVMPGWKTAEGPPYTSGGTERDYLIRGPGINLCIAQTLRSAAPGPSALSTLTLSEADQRQLLEVIRQRAVEAVVGYAQLASVFAATPDISLNTDFESVRAWGADPNNGTMMARLGIHATAAVQLATIASGESVEMMARSAGARVARGHVDEESYAQSQWNYGSWRARGLSVLFGGNPLVTDPIAASDLESDLQRYHRPNQHGTYPWIDVLSNGSNGQVWGPVYQDIDQVDVDITEPEVREFERLAREYDLLELIESNECDSDTSEATALHLYRSIEARLRTDECREYTVPPAPVGCGNLVPCTDAGTCRTFAKSDVGDPSVDFHDFSLWKNRRIALSHATKFARLLRQQFGFCGENRRYKILGNVTSTQAPDLSYTHHFSNDTDFHAPSLLEEQVGLYGSLAEDKATVAADLAWRDAPGLGYGGHKGFLSGIVPALAALRRGLDIAKSSPNSTQPGLATFLDNSSAAAGLITAAVGPWSVSVEPTPHLYVGDENLSKVTVYAPSNDPFWTGTVEMLVYESPDANGALASIVLDPRADKSALTAHLVDSKVGTSASSGGVPPLTRWTFAPIKMSPNGMLVARKAGSEYRLILQDAWFNLSGGGPTAPVTGLHASSGGSFSAAASRLLAVQDDNPSRAFFDGFGFPARLSPPTDPALLKETSTGPSYVQYLQNAASGVGAAVVAISEAFGAQEAEESQVTQFPTSTGTSGFVTLGQQAAKNTQVLVSAKKQFCGEQNPTCDPTLTKVARLSSASQASLLELHTQCNNAGLSPARRSLACAAEISVSPLAQNVDLPNPVAKILTQETPPTLSDYFGGELQDTFTQEWTAYRLLQTQVEQLVRAYHKADARIDAANLALVGAPQEVTANCSPSALSAALFAGHAVAAGFSSRPDSAFSPSAVLAQTRACRALKSEMPASQTQTILRLVEALEILAQEDLRLTAAADALERTAASGQKTANDANVALHLVSTDYAIQTSPNLKWFSRYYSDGLWRARTLMDRARRQAALARRAVESQFAVDLSIMNQAEPFVPSPALWADTVYGYDLNLPASVGLLPAASGSGLTNSLGGFIQNMEQFVRGFAVSRPSVATHSDTEVVSIAGPAQLVSGSAVDARAAKWSFFCPQDAGTWRDIPENGNLATICLTGSPARARLQFFLDPWGQLTDGDVGAAYEKRYNARYGRLAVNLVGTGILDCSKAIDPSACYSQSFVRYGASHVGLTSMIDYDGFFRNLEVPLGQIEGAKALTAEQWLDPLANAWAKPYVAQVARTELSERPLGGSYALVFELGPEVVLSRVEQVQLLLETSYWVKQK
jgi:hypothetical protein